MEFGYLSLLLLDFFLEQKNQKFLICYCCLVDTDFRIFKFSDDSYYIRTLLPTNELYKRNVQLELNNRSKLLQFE